MTLHGIRLVSAAVVFLAVAVCCNKRDEVAGKQPLSVIRTADLRVMSFNVRQSQSPDTAQFHWNKRQYPCVRMFNDVRPDLIGFQETNDDQVDYFERALPGYSSFRIPEKQFANSIFYKTDVFDFLSGGYRWYSLTTPEKPSPTYPDICNDGAYRTFMWVKLRLKGTEKVIWLFNTHLPWNPDKDRPNDAARTRCIEAVASMARMLCAEDETVFVTGDMNCAFSSDAGRKSLRALDEWMEVSWQGTDDADDFRSSNGFGAGAPYMGVSASIDHIFYRNALPLVYRTVVSSGYGVRFISDHYPIYMDCRVEYPVPVYPTFGVSAEGFPASSGNIVF